MTRAALLCACLLLVAASPARAGARVLAYTIDDAKLSERLDFHGDGGPACARAGVCGVSGTVTYEFGGIQDGEAALVLVRRGHRSRASGFGQLLANGITKATVNGPGGGPPCTAQVLRRGDFFDLSGTAGRVRLSFHSPPFLPDFLKTYCAGPGDADVWYARALPRLSLPVSSLRRRHVDIDVSSQRAFHAEPFSGTLSFSASLRLRQIRLPNGLGRFLEQLV
jgi:hypothetical protein